uniref:Protein kinase domain-containing protein n=1 Tax=viral metagenome TaxID=1070528 RepID=A0A6C0JDV6_9ZZZZ
MNTTKVKKLVESKLLDCEQLMLIDIVYRGKGSFGYIFKINDLPLVIKVIPTIKDEIEAEFEITEYIYNIYKKKHKINTILKPYTSFRCVTKDSDMVQNILKILSENKINTSTFYKKRILKDHVYILIYEWADEGDLYGFIYRNNMKERILIKILLTIFCSLKVIKDATNGEFLHNDLHLNNILIKSYKDDINFNYNFWDDEMKVSFKNKYKPLFADFSLSIVKNKYNEEDDFDFLVYHDVFKFANHFLMNRNLINNSEIIIDFLKFVVPKNFRYKKVVHGKRVIVDYYNLHLESKNVPFKKSIEDIIKHPIFSEHVQYKNGKTV